MQLIVTQGPHVILSPYLIELIELFQLIQLITEATLVSPRLPGTSSLGYLTYEECLKNYDTDFKTRHFLNTPMTITAIKSWI